MIRTCSFSSQGAAPEMLLSFRKSNLTKPHTRPRCSRQKNGRFGRYSRFFLGSMSVVLGLMQLGGFTKMKHLEILEYWLIQRLGNVFSTHWSQIPVERIRSWNNSKLSSRYVNIISILALCLSLWSVTIHCLASSSPSPWPRPAVSPFNLRTLLPPARSSWQPVWTCWSAPPGAWQSVARRRWYEPVPAESKFPIRKFFSIIPEVTGSGWWQECPETPDVTVYLFTSQARKTRNVYFNILFHWLIKLIKENKTMWKHEMNLWINQTFRICCARSWDNVCLMNSYIYTE